MRWKYSRNGDRRTIVRFLWLPFYWNGTTYWLEKAKMTQVYSSYLDFWLTEVFTPLKELDKPRER